MIFSVPVLCGADSPTLVHRPTHVVERHVCLVSDGHSFVQLGDAWPSNFPEGGCRQAHSGRLVLADVSVKFSSAVLVVMTERNQFSQVFAFVDQM